MSFLVDCSVAVRWGVCRCVASVSERRMRLAGPAQAREQHMCKRNCLFVLSLTVVSTWADFGIASDSVVRATDIKCVIEPNDQSKHLYYYTDPVTHRKCWFSARTRIKVVFDLVSPQARSSPKPKSDLRSGKGNAGDAVQEAHQSGTRLDARARETLFQEFLLWKERQKQSDSLPIERDALFREFMLQHGHSAAP